MEVVAKNEKHGSMSTPSVCLKVSYQKYG